MAPAAAQKDWAAEERKLSSAYDDTQRELYKPALATVDRVIKKTPRSQPAHVLRAYLLLKLGHAEADVLAAWRAAVAAGGDAEMSERSLWFTRVILRELQRWDILLETYVAAWDRHPESQSHGAQVFLAAASTGDIERAVAASRKMFNMTKSATWARIAAWAVWYEKSRPFDSPSTTVFPPPLPAGSIKIAQVLLSTTRNDVPTPDALWLHLQILLGTEQYDAALALLKAEGHSGGGIHRTYYRIAAVQEIIARKAAKGEDVVTLIEDEVEAFGQLLLDSDDMPRNYGNYRHLITCAERHAGCVPRAKEIFTELDGRVGAKERAPALAALELDAKFDQRMSSDEWEAAVRAYWTRWGGKGVVVDDLQTISEGRTDVLTLLIREWAKGTHETLDEYLRAKHATLLDLKLAVDWAASEGEFDRLWKLYLAGLQYGVNLPKTDVQPADELGLAAVQVLLHLHAAEPRDSILARAAACLQFIIARSPACKGAPFALIRVYRLLGAPNLIAEPFAALKVSEIHLDSLLHVLSERYGNDARAGQLDAVLEEALGRARSMYPKTANSIMDSISTSLEHESFAAIESIQELDRTLKHSISRGITVVETARLALSRGGRLNVKVVKELQAMQSRPDGEWQESRQWDVAPVSVGGKQMQELLPSAYGEKQVRSGWIKSWASVLLRLNSVSPLGAEMGADSNLDFESCTASERAVLHFADRILARIAGGTRETGPTLTQAGQELIEALPVRHPGQASIIALSGLAEARAIVRLVLARSAPNTANGAKSGGSAKGGKKPASGAGAAANSAAGKAERAELDEVQKALEAALRDRVAAVEARLAEDRGRLDVGGVEAAVGDADVARKTVDQLVDARRAAIEFFKSS